MKDEKIIDIEKLNNSIEPAADLPRLPDGKIDIEKIATGKNEKGNYIVPDEILKKYYKELPAGTTNETNTSWAYNGGLLNKADKEVQRMGAEALNAKNAQRRRLAETIDIFLKKKATAEELEQLGLEAGATKQDALIAAMFARAIEQKDVQAFNSLRDTAGEKPTDKVTAEVTALTAEDKELINNISARLAADKNE